MAASLISTVAVNPLTSQSSIASSSFAVQSGDVLVVWGMSTPGTGSAPFSIVDSQGLTWTKRAEVAQGASTNYVVIWTATVATTGNISYTITRPASGPNWRAAAQVWRGVTGIGDTNSGNVSNGQPTTTLVTSADSSIVMAVADNTAIDSSTTYKQADAGTFTPATNYPIVSLFSYAFYAGYYADAGAAGNKIIGISYPNAQNYSIAAIELRAAPSGIQSDLADGYAWYQSPTYATAREGGGTLTVGNTGGTSIGQMFSGGNYYAMQAYFKFNVSGLTNFVSPNLDFYSQYNSSVDRDFDVEIRVHNWGAAVEGADFVPGSQLASKTFIGSINTANWPADAARIPFTIDTAALTAAINAARAADGWLYLVVHSGYQRTNSAPSGIEYVGIYATDLGGLTIPRLTYAIPSGPVVTAELYENGVLKQFLGSREITADGVLSFNWDAATLAALSGANVELRLTSDADIDIGAIEWNAILGVPTGPPAVPTYVEQWGAIAI